MKNDKPETKHNLVRIYVKKEHWKETHAKEMIKRNMQYEKTRKHQEKSYILKSYAKKETEKDWEKWGKDTLRR